MAFVDALHGSVTTPVLAVREGIRRLTSKRSPLEGVIELVREAETAPPSVAIALSNNVAIALSHLLCTVCPLVLLLLSIFGWRMAPRPNASAPTRVYSAVRTPCRLRLTARLHGAPPR